MEWTLLKGFGAQMQCLTLDSWTTAQSGWIKTAPNYETWKERMRHPHRKRDRQTKQIEKEGRTECNREKGREHTH